jgi:hypothetical protein
MGLTTHTTIMRDGVKTEIQIIQVDPQIIFAKVWIITETIAPIWVKPGLVPIHATIPLGGISPLSEPENQNIVYLLKEFSNIMTAVGCHSFGEDIFRPHPSGGVHIPSQPVIQEDHEAYVKLESSLNSAISSISPGKMYDTGTTNNHAGTSDDYLYFAHHNRILCRMRKR